MLRWGNRFAIVGVCLLAVAIGTIVLLVIDVLYEFRVPRPRRNAVSTHRVGLVRASTLPTGR